MIFEKPLLISILYRCDLAITFIITYIWEKWNNYVNLWYNEVSLLWLFRKVMIKAREKVDDDVSRSSIKENEWWMSVVYVFFHKKHKSSITLC